MMALRSLVSMISHLRGSHARKRSDSTSEEKGSISGCEKKVLKKFSSNISSKTHHMIIKMTSWRKKDGVGFNDDDDDDDDAIWRKGIIMGGRCQPLDFSGKILYDCDGNLLPNSSSLKV